jgi:kumamolisin
MTVDVGRRRDYLRFPRTAAPVSMTARAAAWAYGFPLYNPATRAGYTGRGYVGGIIELGGGYSTTQMNSYFAPFARYGYPVPAFIAVPVGQGANGGGMDPQGADGEVQSDMQVAGAVAPGATWRVYFAGNTDEDFEAALSLAFSECNGVTLSWGGPENTWDPAVMARFETVIAAAKGHHVPLFVAAGDAGSGDGSDDGSQVDFPASAPSAIGCGGTRLVLTTAGQRFTEVTWDDNPRTDATGGGVSKAFPGRQVPDIAGNADPDTGYEVVIDGNHVVIAGTSLVAPLMVAGHALLWEAAGANGHTFDYLGLLAGTPGSFYDVTIGRNGAYRAGPGRDDVTGLGVPNLKPSLQILAARAAMEGK